MKRNHLPDTRAGICHEVTIGGQTNMTLRIGENANGQPSEIFIEIDKEGSMIGGMLNIIGTLMSMLMQVDGIDLTWITRKLMFTRFEPSGFTTNEDIRNCSSLADYIAKFLMQRYDLEDETQQGSKA